jgi:predicted secreted protein
MRTRLLLVAVCLSSLAFACSAETATDEEVPVGEPASEEHDLVKRSVMLEADDDGKTVSVNQNQKFTIKLSQSASTGYRWSVKSAGGFGQAERRTVGPGDGRVGGSGWDYFSWNVGDKTGSHTVELVYARSWESGSPAKTFKVKIDIHTALSGKCGGLMGLRCTGGEYCNFTGSVCGRFDQMGECKERPMRCPMVARPVCGCDGQTYSNSCVASARGADVAAEGPCAQ